MAKKGGLGGAGTGGIIAAIVGIIAVALGANELSKNKKGPGYKGSLTSGNNSIKPSGGCGCGA